MKIAAFLELRPIMLEEPFKLKSIKLVKDKVGGLSFAYFSWEMVGGG